MRIGIICPSEIALRRFLPALSKFEEVEKIYVSYASKKEWTGSQNENSDEYEKIQEREKQRAEEFKSKYNAEVIEGYNNLLDKKLIDAVYIPLPPALHYKWARKALKNGIHTLTEKPSTTNLKDTKELVKLAKEKNLALHENYMFIYHSQIKKISEVINNKEIGEVRLIRIDFGFPLREQNDFRYKKELGGGALLDCGGYTLKYANYLLNGDAKVISANAGYKKGFEVEMYASGTLSNKKGEIVQVSFGMDNDYRCNIEVWGSKGTLKSNRILTAPDGFEPSYTITKNSIIQEFKMHSDDAFYKSISKFFECINDKQKRISNYEEIINQEKLVNDFAKLSGIKLKGIK